MWWSRLWTHKVVVCSIYTYARPSRDPPDRCTPHIHPNLPLLPTPSPAPKPPPTSAAPGSNATPAQHDPARTPLHPAIRPGPLRSPAVATTPHRPASGVSATGVVHWCRSGGRDPRPRDPLRAHPCGIGHTAPHDASHTCRTAPPLSETSTTPVTTHPPLPRTPAPSRRNPTARTHAEGQSTQRWSDAPIGCAWVWGGGAWNACGTRVCRGEGGAWWPWWRWRWRW